MIHTYAPRRYLVLTEQWRQGHNRFTFLAAAGAEAAALESAQRKADEVPGNNVILDELLADPATGAYREVARLYPGADGRFLPPLPEGEESPEAEEIDNPILKRIAETAAGAQASEA